MKLLVTAPRIRSILKDARTEKDAAAALRAHRIRYTFCTDGGSFHIRIPSRSGMLRVYRVASRTAPFLVTMAPPAPYQYNRPVWPTWEVDT